MIYEKPVYTAAQHSMKVFHILSIDCYFIEIESGNIVSGSATLRTLLLLIKVR